MGEAGVEAAERYKREKREREGKKLPSNAVVRDNEVNWELAKAAIIAFPDLGMASNWLAEKKISATPGKLNGMKHQCREELAETRKQLAPELESAFADESLDVARMATMAEHIAIERTTHMLEAGMINDPSKVARDLADVKAKNIDKRFAVEGRPTVVTHDRSHEEIIEKLVAMKVLKPAVESTAEED